MARILPFALYMAFLVIEGVVADAVPGLDVRWLYPVKIAVVVAALWYYRAGYIELFARPNLFWAGLIAPLLGVVVFVLWINLDYGWMNLGGGAGYDPRNSTGDFDWPLLVLRLAGAALVVPLMEELFWRSYLMRWIQEPGFLDLAPVQIGLRAILISSVLFGLEHSLWLAGIVAGLAYAWLYRASGSLWPPIISHATTNLVLGLWVLSTGAWQFW
ncbi:MAG: CAAX prenyl protease-related protein [Hydrogenophilales bacterium 28-61-23]|nr:MAG: CAAX prenyl protease-related protein [Hydrogenophilales bacterium 28-61-23]